MKPVTMYENQKILVLGLARSGVSAAKLLHKLGAFVTVNDAKEFEENPEAQELLSLGIRVVTGGHPVDLLDEDFMLIVKNPGIPYTNPILEKAMEQKLPIITEVELAYQIAEAKIIGITGTNGKTTTTTMIGQLLNAGMKPGKAWLAGNIGLPASTIAQKAQPEDVLVTELSSFQLMGTVEFTPSIAVITNLYEAHLDYHGTREEYVKAKWHLQENMNKSHYLVLNYNQPELRELGKQSKATIIPFSTTEIFETGAYLFNDGIYYRKEKIIDTSEIGVPGAHNIENAMAAIVVAKLQGIETSAIKTALQSFSGVEHRTEFIGEIESRKFYNDSKATNILATEKALSGFDNSKVILLAGGLDRGNSFDSLKSSLKGLKGAVFFGETKEKLKEAAQEVGVEKVILTNRLEEAVNSAYEISDKEDAILLSPACASWDQYENFEIRGTAFKEEFKKIKSRIEK